MSDRDRSLLLTDMLEAIDKINKYTSGSSYQDFLEDEKTIDAVVRNFEVLGEAANRIDDDFKLANPQIPWNRLRGLRNRIIHEYFGVDHKILWTIIEDNLVSLKTELVIMLNKK